MKLVLDMQKNKDYRKETQPWNFPCAGSIFGIHFRIMLEN